MTSPTLKKKQDRADFLRRLGYFLFGLAIGCVLVGILFSARAKMVGPREQQTPGMTQPPSAPTNSSPAPVQTP